jgi:hypothetical protein
MILRNSLSGLIVVHLVVFNLQKFSDLGGSVEKNEVCRLAYFIKFVAIKFIIGKSPNISSPILRPYVDDVEVDRLSFKIGQHKYKVPSNGLI